MKTFKVILKSHDEAVELKAERYVETPTSTLFYIKDDMVVGWFIREQVIGITIETE